MEERSYYEAYDLRYRTAHEAGVRWFGEAESPIVGQIIEQYGICPRQKLLELGCGLLVNRSYRVWDYRHMPMNFLGQICLPFTLLWVPLSLAAMLLYGWTDRGILKLVDKD